MDEHVVAVKHFADDLYAVGICGPELAKAACLYFAALLDRSEEAWVLLYRHVSELLQSQFSEALDPCAAQRLLAFVEDDFGIRVLDRPIRARLRELLLEPRVA